MEEFKDQIKTTNDNTVELSISLKALYKQMADFKQQQADLVNSGKGVAQEYNALAKAIVNCKTNIDSTVESLKFWTKAYDGAKGNLEGMTNLLVQASDGFKPLAENTKKATEILEPFKKGVSSFVSAFKESKASGVGTLKSLKNAFGEVTGGLKGFKLALAEIGIGLVIIAFTALIEKLQTFKPIIEFINGIVAATGAVMSKLGNFIMHPIDNFKNLGSSMANAAKDAYKLSIAQEKLSTAFSAQEVANEAIQTQVDLLKEQTTNTKLNIQERQKALDKAKSIEKNNYEQNKKLADQAMANAIEDARIKGNFHKDELERLKKLGTQYAATLLENGQIDQQQFEAIKKADQDLIKLNKEQSTAHKEFLETQDKLNQEAAEKRKARQDAAAKAAAEQAEKRKLARDKERELKKERDEFIKQADEDRMAATARMAKLTLEGYAKEVDDENTHFNEMTAKYNKFLNDYSKMSVTQKAIHLKEYIAANATIQQLQIEHNSKLSSITQKFQEEDSKKLDEYFNTLNKIGQTARQEAQSHLDEDYKRQTQEITKIKDANDSIIFETTQKLKDLQNQPENEASKTLITELRKRQTEAQNIFDKSIGLLAQLKTKHTTDTTNLNKDFNEKESQDKNSKAEDKVKGEITEAREGGHESAAIKKEIALLKMQHEIEVKAAKERGEATTAIDEKFAKQKALLEDNLVKSKIHAGDKLIDAVLKNTKKDTAVYKAAFLAKKATSIADTIISTKQSVMESFKAYSGIPFVGQALGIAQAAFMAVQGATSIAEIVKQKPGMARGGQFISDGRGAVLPGYSRTDNTNAYLRSGEAVVVSEAMRNPWARNLVSAINVAHGGRDFSVPNAGRGYAIGGIFTDGGNANRYYSQPVKDHKDLANTLAYQMINNFPPIYVDVKDVNNQQNILAQTVNRVNL